MKSKTAAAVVFLLSCFSSGFAQQKVPYDLWNDSVRAAIRDQSTLEDSVNQLGSFFGVLSYDVFFTSNPSADYYDAAPPYSEHQGEKIRIHAFLAVPSQGGPYPALVIGHGHGGQADLAFARQVAMLGLVALYIDGPEAGQSTGGPQDENQAWISVDKGPQYGYLYHYGYAGMRALTMLERLARMEGNPYRIDPDRLGALGASMGGIFTTYLNGIDSRMKVAIIMASAGSWAHTLRYPNSWLYHGLYASTRDQPYNGSDPLNSIEDIDRDPTAITFLNYFDPIRYAPRQYAPVMTVIGTHDGYFPLPNPNLMFQTMASAGQEPNFEKRLWLIPNAPHDFSQATDLLRLYTGLKGFVDYAVGNREKPLATPQVAMTDTGSGLRFEISLAETAARLDTIRSVSLFAATRVDSTKTPINDFKEYPASRAGDRFVSQIPAGEKSPSGDTIGPSNVIYFATATDGGGLPVSSLVSKGPLPMDLSTDFTPKIDQYPGDSIVVPTPPPAPDAVDTITSSTPVTTDSGYQGIALSNPTNTEKGVRVEARTPEGRIAVGEGLINPVYLSLPPRTQQVFVNEEWFGKGARLFDGSLHTFWTDAPAASLFFRGSGSPTELDGIGPASPPATSLWLPLAPEQDGTALRRLRIFGAETDASVQIAFRNKFGDAARIPAASVQVPAHGMVDITPPTGSGALEPASAEIEATNPVSARLEVTGVKDPWSIEAQPVPTGNRYFQPHTEWNGIFTTRLLFLNPSGNARRVTPHLRNRDGSEIGLSTFFVVNPLAVASYAVESLFPVGDRGPGAGWIDLETPDGPLLIVALAVDSRTGAAAASAVGTGGAGLWSMPFYVESLGYWTGLAIANVGDKPSDIQITALDRSGTKLGQWIETLKPQQSQTQLVAQWIRGLPAGTTGQITIRTSGTAALLAYFGTDDGLALAAIPFTLITP